MSTITFIRNRRWSKRLWGRSSLSCSRVDVVRTDTGKRSMNEPARRGEGRPAWAKKAELLFYERLSVARRVDFLDIWVVLVDGEVIRGSSSQSDVSSEVC